MAVKTDIKQEVIQSVRAARGTQRRACIQEWARLLHISESTIYRWAKNGTRTRSDAGARRTEISDQAWMQMVAIYIEYGYTAEEVTAHAHANGWTGERVHPKTFSSWLRAAGIGRNKMEDTGKRGLSHRSVAHRRFEAEAPNRLHQIDLTEIPRYFISEGNTIGWESVLTAGKNKPNKKPRIHLYAIVDDHSRCCYARLYTTKEVTGWIDFCHRAWSGDGSALMGCPDILYTDNDSAAKSNLFLGFLERAGTEIQTHAVGAPQAKGKVERLLGTIQGTLTRALRPLIDRGGIDLGGANEVLSAIVAQYNARPHSSTGIPPSMRYEVRPEDMREMPPIPRERHLFVTSTPLLRPDWSVRIGGLSYQLPRTEPFTSRIGEKIRIDAHHHEAERHILIAIIDGVEYEIPAEPVVPDQAGDYKATPKSDADRLIEQARDIDLSKVFDPLLIYQQDQTTEDPQILPLLATPPPTPEPSMTRRQVKLRLIDEGVVIDVARVETLMGHQARFTEDAYKEIRRKVS